jgi:CRISPR-associated exonuclease Cas4
MFSEDDFLPLSGLQHMAFCERRWALVQIENIWEENRFTAEGNLLHEKAHSGDVESRPGVLVRRTVPVHSFRLGLSGQADIVEFQPAEASAYAVSLVGRRGLWRPYPIEYKRSRDKSGSLAYRIQLCAQALCLEEMLDVHIVEGAIYDGSTKRRQPVCFDVRLRESVKSLAAHMHDLFRTFSTPSPVLKKACQSCSLKERCFPEALSIKRSVQTHYRRFLRAC